MLSLWVLVITGELTLCLIIRPLIVRTSFHLNTPQLRQKVWYCKPLVLTPLPWDMLMHSLYSLDQSQWSLTYCNTIVQNVFNALDPQIFSGVWDPEWMIQQYILSVHASADRRSRLLSNSSNVWIQISQPNVAQKGQLTVKVQVSGLRLAISPVASCSAVARHNQV